MEKIIILGKGGHARSVADTIEREGKYQIAGYIVNDEEVGQVQDEYPVIGTDESLVELYEKGIHCAAIGIGFLGKGSLRKELCAKLKKIGYLLPVICDPSAFISTKVKVEEGVFIGKGVIINAGVTIGRACIINSGAIIEHDCHIGEFSHISVGTVLCGGVSVGDDVFVGANATVIQEINVGNKVTIGAGEVLKKNINDNTVYRNCDFLGGGMT